MSFLRPVFAPAAVCLTLLLASPAPAAAGDTPIVPERGVVLYGEGQPDWMIEWQQARRLLRIGKEEQAVEAYARLLAARPLLEAARWEYCRLLVHRQRHTEAARCIDLLLKRRNVLEYHLAAGQVALKTGQFAKAAEEFGRVLEQQPAGPHAASARRGLAESLRGSGRHRLSLTLEEPLPARSAEEDFSRLSRLLKDALAIKSVDSSRRFVRSLGAEKLQRLDEQTLTALQSLLLPQEGLSEEADPVVQLLLREQLRRHPEDLKSRQRLAAQLEAAGAYHEALAVLEGHFAGGNPDAGRSPELLLAIAELAAGKAARPEVALGCWQEFLRRHPGNDRSSRQVQKRVRGLHDRLAGDFLVLVENGSAVPLWRDLERFGVHRREIFLRMAERLVERNRRGDYDLAAELLGLVRSRVENSPELAQRVAALLQRMKRWQEALVTLRTVPERRRSAEWFRNRAELESTVGNELAAAGSWRRYLRLKPADQKVRRLALLLFARLGMVEEQKELFSWWLQAESGVELETVLLHLHWLGRNHQLDSVVDVAGWAAELWRDQPEKVTALRLAEADALSRSGNFPWADLRLRQALNLRTDVDRVLLALALNAARAGHEKQVEAWLAEAEAAAVDSRTLSPAVIAASAQFIRSRLALSRRQKEQAQEAFGAGREALAELKKSGSADLALPISLLAEVCAAPAGGGAVLTADCRRTTRRFKISLQSPGEKLLPALPSTAPSLQLLRAEQSVRQRNYAAALPLLTRLLRKIPRSIFARILLAETELGLGKYHKAGRLIDAVAGKEYDSPSVCRLQLRLDTAAGEYTSALEHFHRCWGPIDSEDAGNDTASDEKLAVHLFNHGQPEEAAQLARLLWSAQRYSDALAVYRAILDQPVMDSMTTRLIQNSGAEPGRSGDSFWSFFRPDTAGEEESLKALLAPALLLDNLGSSTGVLLARHSRRLAFQLRLLKEYDARIAIWERRYLYAEKRYQDLLAEEGGVQTMADLAALYKRMGQYNKEARLYRRIESRGAVTRPLAASMADSFRRIAPKTGAEFSYKRLDGERNYRNIDKLRYGVVTTFTHEQDKEIQISWDSRHFRSLHNRGGMEGSLNVDRLGSVVTWQPGDSNELELGFAVDRLESGGVNLLVEAGGEMQLNEQVTGSASFRRKEITDTLDVIADRILDNRFVAGIDIQTPSGIGFGGDLSYWMRSDSNDGNGLHTWLGWSRFAENSRWELRWDSRYESNSHSGDSYNYHTPESWNSQLLSASCQYCFGGSTEPGYGRSHITTRFGFGVENNDTAVSSAGVDIFLEISHHVLFQSNVGFTDNRDCETIDFSAALQYRW